MSVLYDTIDKLCKEQDTNITRMCKEIGVSRGALSDLNTGRSKGLTTKNLRRIAEYLHCPIEILISLNEEDPKVNVIDLFTSNSVLEDAQKVIDKIEIAPHRTVKDDLKDMVNGLSDF